MSAKSLVGINVESVRFSGERSVGDALVRMVGESLKTFAPIDAERIRRELLTHSLRLAPSMAPRPHAWAQQALETFGIDSPVEIYQRNGQHNASIHLVREPILMEVHGSIVSLLDDQAGTAAMGHELGHWLAHRVEPGSDLAAHAMYGVLSQGDAADEMKRVMALQLSMSRELTADRFGLLACGDLDACLRMNMSLLTGLPTSQLRNDTTTYLAQCKAFADAAEGQIDSFVSIKSHPEHSVRSWALFLFSESDRYQQLTGLGPGTRPIEEVDQTIKELIAADTYDANTNYAGPDNQAALPALAAAVIVGHADGELTDDELAVIEDSFATIVDGWQEFLDKDVAYSVFGEQSPLLASADARTHSAFFLLLTHVVVADGRVREAEISMVLAIGQHIGCDDLFTRLMEATLESIGEERDGLGRGIDLPLPPKRTEVDAAFTALLGNVHRQRVLTTTLSDLTRFIGESRCDSAVVDRLSKGLRTADIVAQPALVDAGYHDTILLRSMADPPEETTTYVPFATGEAHDALRHAVMRLRDRLVSGDGRSPAIRIHTPSRRRTFDLAELNKVSPGGGERALALIQARERAVLVSTAQAGSHTEGRRCSTWLKSVVRTHTARVEESGARDLYAGAPFLAGKTDDYVIRAPLILYPGELRPTLTAGGGWAFLPDEDNPPQVNHALVRLIFDKRGLPLSDEALDGLDQLASSGAEAVLNALETFGIKTVPHEEPLQSLTSRKTELELLPDNEIHVEPSAAVGIFPQSRSELLHDYNDLISAIDRRDVPLEELLGAGAELLPPDLREQLHLTRAAPDKDTPPPLPPSCPRILRNFRS